MTMMIAYSCMIEYMALLQLAIHYADRRVVEYIFNVLGQIVE